MRRPEAAARPASAPLAAMLLAMALAAAPPALAASPDPQAEVESSLMCHCGCTDLTVKVCNCGTAAAIKSDIAARLASGSTVAQVVDAYVAQYGEQIRSAPTREGFNLLAWIMPFAAILAGGFLVVTLVRRWRRDPGALPAPDAPLPAGAGAGGSGAHGAAAGAAGSADEAALRERVEREMRESL